MIYPIHRPACGAPQREPHGLIFAVACGLCAIVAPPTHAEIPDIVGEDEAVARAVQIVAPSVVKIRVLSGPGLEEDPGRDAGETSGVVVGEGGFVITSDFGLPDLPASVLVTLADGTQSAAQIVSRDHSRHLVLLELAVDRPLPVPTATPDAEVKVGAWAIAVGRTVGNETPNVSVGIISAVDRLHGKAIQSDAKISPLNYGGALVDIHGRVLGVLVPLGPQASEQMAGVEWYDSGVGFAIPMTHVFQIVESLKTGTDLHAGILGVSFDARGAYVSPPKLAAVLPNSPATEAGLRVGDVITEADGRPVGTVMHLRNVLGKRYAGDKVRLVVARGQQRLVREVELVDRLRPFEHAFLGILPIREPETSGDVPVRFVYPASPADQAEIQPGDRILSVNDRPVQDIADVIDELNTVQAGDEVSLVTRRNESVHRRHLAAASLPTEVPRSLPPARSTLSEQPASDGPPVGVIPLRLPEYANTCTLYVPENYDARVPHGVVVALTLPDQLDPEHLRRLWQPYCDTTDIILAVAQPNDVRAWRPAEVRLVQRVLDHVRDHYTTDPLRIVVHGYRAGGAMACLVAFSSRDVVRGLSIVQAALPDGLAVPANDPVQRLAVQAARCGEGSDARAIARSLQRLRDKGYPVSTQIVDDPARYVAQEELDELVRWIDSLDRF